MSLTLTLKRGSDTITGEGTDFTLYGTVNGGELDSVQLKGDTTQTTYTGKNKLIFPGAGTSVQKGIVFTANSDGTLTLNGQNNNSGNSVYYFVSNDNPMTLPAGTYTVSGMAGTQTITFYDGNTYYDKTAANPTLVLDSATTFVNIYFQVRKGDTTQYTDYKVSPMIEAGQTATAFEPYVGGVASPNPDYPQNVNVVSGTQTITITDGGSQSQTKTVRLGSLELCKIGTYQDYIYKSGDDWYVHKETSKLSLNGTEDWETGTSGGKTFYRASIPSVIDQTIAGFSNYFTSLVSSAGLMTTDNSIRPSSGSIAVNPTSLNEPTLANWKTWLGTHNTVLYGYLASATDTKITDAELTTDLDRLVEASTYNGETTVSVSGDLTAYLVVESGGTITKTYTESELSSPFTISDVEGKSQNTTLDGNIYVDYAYNKHQFSVDIFNLTPTDYAEIRAFYTFQFAGTRFPTISIPELEISDMPVYMEMSARNIVNQCLLTDKITLKFRETVQP